MSWANINQRTIWTDERVSLLTTRWAAGEPASAIARILKVSRGAVCGKLDRLNLLGTRGQDVGRMNIVEGCKRRPSSLNKAAGIGPQPKPRPFVERPAPVDVTLAKPWYDRAFGECAYPVGGEGADTVSCCNPTHGHTYCGAHRAIMYETPKAPQPSHARRAA